MADCQNTQKLNKAGCQRQRHGA